MGPGSLLHPFYRLGLWGSEMLSILPKLMQLMNGRGWIQTQIACPFHYYAPLPPRDSEPHLISPLLLLFCRSWNCRHRSMVCQFLLPQGCSPWPPIQPLTALSQSSWTLRRRAGQAQQHFTQQGDLPRVFPIRSPKRHPRMPFWTCTFPVTTWGIWGTPSTWGWKTFWWRRRGGWWVHCQGAHCPHCGLPQTPCSLRFPLLSPRPAVAAAASAWRMSPDQASPLPLGLYPGRRRTSQDETPPFPLPFHWNCPAQVFWGKEMWWSPTPVSRQGGEVRWALPLPPRTSQCSYFRFGVGSGIKAYPLEITA